MVKFEVQSLYLPWRDQRKQWANLIKSGQHHGWQSNWAANHYKPKVLHPLSLPKKQY